MNEEKKVNSAAAFPQTAAAPAAESAAPAAEEVTAEVVAVQPAAEEANPAEQEPANDTTIAVTENPAAGSVEIKKTEAGSAPQTAQAPAADYAGEVAEFLKAHPEMQGQQMPNEVFRAYANGGGRLLNVYDAYIINGLQQKIKALEAENETLRQNADNALRAPVTAAAGGAAPEPEDPFLRGFGRVR